MTDHADLPQDMLDAECPDCGRILAAAPYTTLSSEPDLMQHSLFKRGPTNDEKVYYREQWGGVPPLRCFYGLACSFAIGLFLGLAL